jgi:NAD(P)H-hydrate epimerase
VRLAVPESLQPLFAARVLEATTLGLPETDVEGEVDPELAVERVLDVDHDALIIGPGLRPGLATVEFVEQLLDAGTDAQPAAVIDAEALNSLASRPDWWERVERQCVLTPHPGEFRRLRSDQVRTPSLEVLGNDDEVRVDVARAAAAEWRQTVVLKGARTVIAAADGRTSRAPFENPALASGGTGDVLAGVIGSLLAQHVAPYDAARLGVYLHGLAGEHVREHYGDAGLLASDLPDELARARRRLSLVRDRFAGRPLGFSPQEARR